VDIFLTGFMGTGKTTAGLILAHRYGFDFIDVDEEIEAAARQSVPAIFRQEGEEGFRQRESMVLSELIEGDGRVIATGGGTFLSEHNRSLVRAGQHVMCLTASPEELARRLNGTGDRPLLPNPTPATINSALEARKSVYALFEQIETSQKTAERVVDDLAIRLDISRVANICFDRRMTTQIEFESGLLKALGSLLSEHGLCGPVVLVTDSGVEHAGWVAPAVGTLREKGYEVVPMVVPNGEAHKTLHSLSDLLSRCVAHRLDRSTVVLALGGGMIGDLAGMLAATYLRGVTLVQVPTTLLAQVDAAIGGKVAVDVEGAKNLAGAFHPAELVLIDPDTLRTLPHACLSDGLAEIVKIGLMFSNDLLSLVRGMAGPRDILSQTSVIRRAAHVKADVVRRDPYEKGERALLNFGHTIGHAIEAASNYELSHGQSVGIGMLAEASLGAQEGFTSSDVIDLLHSLLPKFGLTRTAFGISPDVVMSYVAKDKKRLGGVTRFAIPETPGHGRIVQMTDGLVRRSIEFALDGGRR
jgi:shikimate kinase / 3-dehydroquinate synthase